MAKLTLLQMVTQAAAEIGQTPPAFITSNTDTTAVQMLALAQREGRETTKRAGAWGGWPQLRGECTFTTIPGQASYSFPVDFQFLLNSTAWDRTTKWQLLGPLEAQEWQVLKSGITVSGPRLRYRIMTGKVYFDPTPTVADSLVFEYISNNWCTSGAGVAQPMWAADTDTFVLDDDLMVCGLKWRFLRAKGLDYAQEFDEYQDKIGTELARAGGARALPLNARALTGAQLINQYQLPDTGYGT